MIVEIRVYSYFLQNVFLRYRQVVTLKRTCIVVAITWIKSTFVAALYPVDFRITISYGCIVIPLCVIVSFVSYTRIFWALRHRSNEVQDLVQHRNSQRTRWILCDTEKPWTVLCQCSWCYLFVIHHLLWWRSLWLLIKHLLHRISCNSCVLQLIVKSNSLLLED